MNNDIKQQIGALKAQIAALEAKVNATADDSWPKDGDDVWVFTSEPQHFTFDSTFPWMPCAALDGRFFRTNEECQQHHDALCVVEELRRTPGRRAFIQGARNYALRIDVAKAYVGTIDWESVDGGWQSIYWESGPERDATIKTVGEDRIIAAAKLFRERA